MKSFGSHHRLMLAALLVIAAACSSKSPTEPGQGPVSPKVPAPTPTYTITVTANPGSLTVGSTQGSNITVRSVNIQDGTPPPDLTGVTLATTLGSFNNQAGPTSLILQLVHGQAQAVLFAGTSTGTATLAATLVAGAGGQCSGCVGSGAGTVTIVAAGTFFLNSVAPSTGDPAGGTLVTISGGGFVAPVSVSFGNSSASVQHVSPGAIQVLAPPSTTQVPVGTTLPVNITVVNNLGGTTQSSATLSNGFTYVPGGGGIQQPQVFSLTPASGTNDGGTVVTITGQGFVAPVQVFFGSGGSATSFSGVEATVQSVTATKIVAVSPPARGFGQDNTNLLVSVLIKNLNTGFATVDGAAFKYGSKVLVTSIDLNTTVYNLPVKVTVFGQGFADPVAVSLAGIGAQVLSTSGTEIQILSGIPNISTCSNLSGPVHVTNINNGDSGDGPIFVYLVPKPVVTGVSPSSAIVSPGSFPGVTLTLTGGLFAPNSDQVQIGPSSASVDPATSTPTKLIVSLPTFNGTFPTIPCTSGGLTGTMNVGIAENVVVTDARTGCTTTLTGGFTYQPADVSCHVTPPPPPPAPKASFTFSEAKASFTVIFNDTSTGPPTSWTWDFGDTTGSNLQNPVHSYAAVPKTYTVSLTACNVTGCSTTAQFVTVPGP